MGPHIGDAEATWHVGFRLKASHDWTRLVVGFCDNTSSEYNSYGFVPMDTLELMQPGTWTEHHYTWTRPAGKSRLAFRMIRDMQDGDMRTVYIDNVRIEKCGIYNLRNYRTDAFGTYVEWTTCGTPVVSIGIRRADRTNDSVVTTGTSPMHITGLEAGTRYILSFYTQCGSEEGLIVGGNLVFSMPEEIPDAEYDLTFYSTLNNGRYAYHVDAAHPVVHALPRGEVFNMEYSCNNAVYTCHPPIRVYIPDSIYLPYCGPFYHENGQSGLPNGWSIFYTDTNCQPRLFFDWSELPLVVGCEGNEWGRSQYTVMPPVATHGHLIIRATIHCNWDSERWIEIGTMVNGTDTASFIPLVRSTRWDDWETLYAETDSLGDRRIAFRTYHGNVFLNNVSLGNFPSNTVQIIAPGDSLEAPYLVEYGPRGFSQGSGTLIRITANPTLLTLAPNSDYDFYFRCDSNTMSCDNAQQIHTLNAPIVPPVCFNFDDLPVDGIPEDWTSQSAATAVSSSTAHSGANALCVANRIVTTAIDIDSLQQMSLGLWVYAEHPSDRLLVGTMTDSNGDGMNDRWVIVNLLEMGEYSMNELWIYDRFGALVYHVENIHRLSDFWDPNQTNSPDGTYYFRFSAKNNFGLVKRNGVIEVTR